MCVTAPGPPPAPPWEEALSSASRFESYLSDLSVSTGNTRRAAEVAPSMRTFRWGRCPTHHRRYPHALVPSPTFDAYRCVECGETWLAKNLFELYLRAHYEEILDKAWEQTMQAVWGPTSSITSPRQMRGLRAYLSDAH